MADYGVNIKFNIVGESGLDRAKKKAEQLAKSVDSIRGIDIENPRNVGGKGGKKSRNQIKQYRQDMDNLVKKINETGEAFGKTNNAQNATAESLQEYVNGVKIGTQRHKDATQALKTQTKNLGLNNSQYLQNTKIQNQNTKATRENSKAKQQNAKYQRGNMGNILSSGIIGGSFPLLFGQTGPAAVGGAVGGAAGGLFGGQFGFALSIAGTAIGQFIQEQDKLDASLLKISRSFENAGNSAGFTRESFNELKKTTRMTKDEVLGVASAFARYGEAGASASFIFGDNPNTFKNLAAIRDTKTLMAAIVDAQNGLSISQQIQLLREAKLTSFKDMQLKVSRMITEENYKREILEARQITRSDRILDFMKQYYKFLLLTSGFNPASIVEKSFKGIFQRATFNKELQGIENLVEKIFPNIFDTAAEKVEDRVEKITKELEKFRTELPLLQEAMEEFSLEMESMSYSIPGAMDQASAELRKLTSMSYMVVTVADTIGNAFEESFKGIVKGSMTAQEALRNLFMRTADAFLDMAAQIIAKQIQMKILGIGLNLFMDQGLAPSRGATTGGTDRWGRDFDDENFGMLPKRANGGAVRGGSSYLVGERGPELFSPGVSGMITPNHALGGSTSIVVNVDASGSSVEGDEQQGRELGRMISVAIQSELIKQKRPGGLLT